MRNLSSFRRRLREWYEGSRRELPWRQTRDPYRIWVSEVMLQQTRAAAVAPYYERFLARFPDISSLAEAAEEEVLTLWSGLGYYRRARNLHHAARIAAEAGGFPQTYESIRALPGAGDYTAAAVASIAFGLPYPAVDGNVLRVLARLENEPGDIGAASTKRRLTQLAGEFLDRRDPGMFNQAMMELGATVCLPRNPRCQECPVSAFCKARRMGRENQVPLKLRRGERVQVGLKVLIITRNGSVLMRRRDPDSSRLAGFWELPSAEDLPQARILTKLCEFRHSITVHDYHVEVYAARVRGTPKGCFWTPLSTLCKFPVTSIAKKAMRCYSSNHLTGEQIPTGQLGESQTR